MKFFNCLGLLLAMLLAVGCGKTVPPAAPASLDDMLPKQAQAKLPTMKIYLGAETLDAELALTGQQDRKSTRLNSSHSS